MEVLFCTWEEPYASDDEDFRLRSTSLVRRRDVKLVDMQAKLDELLLFLDQQIGQYEKEPANVCIKGRGDGFDQEQSRGRHITRPDCYRFRE